MKKLICLLSIIAASSTHARYQEICKNVKGGMVCTPPTSMQYPLKSALAKHIKHKDYTNYTTFIPDKKLGRHTSVIETPASLACIYGLTPNVPGCPVNGTTAIPSGGSGYIGIIDRNYSSTLVSDFNTFSTRYGLPTCTGTFNPTTCETTGSCFQVINITGKNSCPPDTTDHGGEEHIDVQWSHAMAPNANIILFMGDDDMSIGQMAEAASAQLAALGGGILSISLSGPEYAGELADDASFQTPGIVYVVSAGDNGPPARYPSSSPYVIAAGGTMVVRDDNGNFIEEEAWNIDGGIGAGGPSLYEPRPAYQNGVQKIVGKSRGVPDIAFAAHQLSIYNSTTGSQCMTSGGGWCGANGTSISAPALAGLLNTAGRRFNSSQDALNYIYTEAAKNYHANWNDIVKGNNGYPALPGYDLCTGLGTPRGYGGK